MCSNNGPNTDRGLSRAMIHGCQKHGYILMADGSESDEFVDQNSALDIIENASLAQLNTEAKRLSRMAVIGSAVAFSKTDVGSILQRRAERYNKRRYRTKGIDAHSYIVQGQHPVISEQKYDLEIKLA